MIGINKYKKLFNLLKNRYKLVFSPYGHEYGRMAIRNHYQDIKQKIQTKTPIIVDGGTNKGDVTFDFLRLFKNNCVIHCFEPNPEFEEVLKDKFNKNKKIIFHNKALGNENKSISFNITNCNFASSVLKPAKFNQKHHGEMTDIKQILEVEQVRLDSILHDDIDVLKMDLQGYELQALQGCGDLLERIKLIYTEVEFVSLYENQALFGDIDCYLRQKGFKLFNLYDIYTGNDGQLGTADAIYLNTRYYPD